MCQQDGARGKGAENVEGNLDFQAARDGEGVPSFPEPPFPLSTSRGVDCAQLSYCGSVFIVPPEGKLQIQAQL